MFRHEDPLAARMTPKTAWNKLSVWSRDATMGTLAFGRYRVLLPWGKVKRWLYKGGRPGRLARLLNRRFATVHASGRAPDHWVTLEVVGRRSGRTISLPLVMAVLAGERYLVSMLGSDVAWVRNVKAAAGHAVLRHGRVEQVRLEELAIEKRAPVLKAYLQRAPGARPHIPVDKDAPLAEFEAIAEQIPVFRVLAAGCRIGAHLPGTPPTADRSAQVSVPNTTQGRLELAVARSAALLGGDLTTMFCRRLLPLTAQDQAKLRSKALGLL